MDGEFLRLDDTEHGRVTTFDNVFGCGNVVTGKGNLVGKVDWNPTDLKRIRAKFFWAKQPVTIQVRLAQEDLWVYEALLRIIAATNEL